MEAQQAPLAPAPATPVEPCAKKRRTATAAQEAPASPVKSKAKRRAPAASAYSLWSLEHRATVVGG